MPAISAVPFVTVPAVRVLVSWADTPAAAYATVVRIDCETGEETQLRPYVAYSSDGSILLSCGQAVFWDTELPFDRCIRYCTRALTASGAVISSPPTASCLTPPPVQSCSIDLMVSSSGFSMLRDPMRPCNDLHVGICWTPDPNCVPGRGVFFQRLEGEGYAANSIDLRAFNSPRPASASRERSDAASTLVLVSRTFADRDALLEILRAGTPLLWQAPPEYGQPDRYIQIGDVGITRYNEDHRYQPRTFTLPFLVEDRPEGPSQGICGARVMDLCDTYTSWTAMEAAQLSYQDLLLGLASPDGPPDPNRRRWIDVETGFANWLAVETAPNTWKTLRDGE